jgi:hypothetical protein
MLLFRRHNWHPFPLAHHQLAAVSAEPMMDVFVRAAPFADVGSRWLVQVRAQMGTLFVVRLLPFGLIPAVIALAHRLPLSRASSSPRATPLRPSPLLRSCHRQHRSIRALGGGKPPNPGEGTLQAGREAVVGSEPGPVRNALVEYLCVGQPVDGEDRRPMDEPRSRSPGRPLPADLRSLAATLGARSCPHTLSMGSTPACVVDGIAR